MVPLARTNNPQAEKMLYSLVFFLQLIHATEKDFTETF